MKRYVFLKNIVLHNIVCETNWIVITTKFYRWFCEKVTQKTETGLLGPGPSSCVIQTKWHIYKKCLKYRVYSIRATFLNLVLKGHHGYTG